MRAGNKERSMRRRRFLPSAPSEKPDASCSAPLRDREPERDLEKEREFCTLGDTTTAVTQ